MVSLSDIKKGLFRYGEVKQGWIVSFESGEDLLKAAAQVRDSKIKEFDCFTPFPMHGLEEAMGLGRSWVPFITLVFGMLGAIIAFSFMTYVDSFDWPMNIGGKPHHAWPAYIPITFELMVLFGGLATAGSVIFLGRLGKIKRKPPAAAVTSDSFALWVGDNISETEVKNILGEYAKNLNQVSEDGSE